MKQTQLKLWVPALLLVGLIGGCSPKDADPKDSPKSSANAENHDDHIEETSESGHDDHGDHDEEEGEETVTFKGGHGLAFPPEVLAAMDVRTADVEERVLPLTLDLVAQVYNTLSSPQAVAFVSSAAAKELRTGLSASIQGHASAERAAKLTTISRTAETAAHHVELIFSLPTGSGSYELGETLSLRLILDPVTSTLTVPRSALLDTALGTFVYLLNGSSFLRTAVVIGAMDEDFVAITDGVSEGDTVVTAPVSQLWLTELRLTKGGGHSH